MSPEQVENWANRHAPLGMTPAEFKQFNTTLFDALKREGFEAAELDIRLQGSSARFFSGEHKSLPLPGDHIDHPQARARMDSWLGDEADRPLRRPFDSMHRLGLDDEPSDFDIQISSDAMADECHERWQARGASETFLHDKYGFVEVNVQENVSRALGMGQGLDGKNGPAGRTGPVYRFRST